MKKIQIFDSTLRDGAQSAGISFSVDDKLNIIKILDGLGFDFIEAGNPHSSANEAQFFERLKKLQLKNAQIVAFGSTRRKNSACQDDANLQSLLNAQTKTVAIFGKSSSLHVEQILMTTKEQNLSMIFESVRFLKEHNKTVIYDAEHFFDGYFLDSAYALQTLKAAIDGGADQICLCDTNGAAFTQDVQTITQKVAKMFAGVQIGIHCHNDCGLAVANSQAAVFSGANCVQGTFLGFGERCGNANLSTIILNLQLKAGYICIPQENLAKIYPSALKIAEISNITIPKGEPYIGSSAFSHKAGMHADGVIKNSTSFEHINPETIGNKRHLQLSEMSGKSAVLAILKKYFPTLDKNGQELDNIIAKLKDLARQGYQFEAAEESFVLHAYKILNSNSTSPFTLVSLKTEVTAPAQSTHDAFAKIKVKAGNKIYAAKSQAVGPVNAIDLALRRALIKLYPKIEGVWLKDYKVRVIDFERKTGARTRVLITSTDGQNEWTTIGVSADIIKASYIALSDSIEYYLTFNK